MASHSVVPLLPGVAYTARGPGQFDLTTDVRFPAGPRLSGSKGSVDLLVVTGATGLGRTLCYLTDDPVNRTNYIFIGLDTSNRPRVIITDHLGTTVALVTRSAPASIAAGVTLAIRLAWDSTALVDELAGRYASFTVNRDKILDSEWATDPTSTWTSFQPTHLVLGRGLSTSDFNGTISAAQVSNVVTP